MNYPQLLKYITVVSLSSLLWSHHISAKVVDTELVIMVDVSGSVNNTDFDLQKQTYANVFRSTDIMNAIHSGSSHEIAVSMVLWSGSGQQYTAVEWMNIYDSASANAFADAILASTRQYSGQTAIGEALEYATKSFGHETNNTSNGYESLYQVIHLAGDGRDNASGPRRAYRHQNVRDARDSALQSGVDRIDAFSWDQDFPDLNTYYEENVIGSISNEHRAQVIDYSEDANLEYLLTEQLLRQVTLLPSTQVPEPSSTFMILTGALCLLIRRNK